MEKRCLSILLALCMVLALLPGMALAEGSGEAPAEPENTDFVIDENGVLTAYNGPGGNVVIPDSVTAIGSDVFKRNMSLTSVTIPEGVTSIGTGAFQQSALTSVTISSSVNSLEANAFYNCSLLTSVVIPSGVASIGDMVFAYCTSLTSVTVPSSLTEVGVSVFNGCNKVTDVYYEGDEVAWNSIKIKLALSSGTINMHYNSTGPEITEIDGFVIADGLLTEYKGDSVSVVIPDGITSIGVNVFKQNSTLICVTIPDGVKSIGQSAFFYCQKLACVSIPASVTSIGVQAFDYCNSLTDVYYGGTEEQWAALVATTTEYSKGLNSAIIHCNSTMPEVEIVEIDGFVIMNGLLIEYKGEGGDIVIPEGVTGIGVDVFTFCNGLTSVTIPTGVTSIGNSAFFGCMDLTSVTIPDSVANIGSQAFDFCWDLTDVYYGSSSVQWKYLAAGQDYLNDAVVHCGDGVTLAPLTDSDFTIDEAGVLTGYTGLSDEVAIPDGVTAIGPNVFAEMSTLKSVTIPASVTDIGEKAFYNCTALISVDLADSKTDGGIATYALPEGDETGSEGVSSIGASAFENCTELERVAIPNGVTRIGKDAFRRCDKLISVAIPDTVVSIEDEAFQGCHVLASVVIPASVTSIGANVFSDLTNIYYVGTEEQWVEIQIDETTKSALENVTVSYEYEPPANEDIGSQDGDEDFVVVNGVLTEYRGSGYKSNVVIPSSLGIVKIGPNAFEMNNLATLVIPEGVTTIGENAFRNCTYLSSVTIPSTVNVIEDYAFLNCSALTSVTIPAGVRSINPYAFYRCSSLTSVTIPAGVTRIGKYAFYKCEGLTSVTIPSSVTSIGTSAFHDCTALPSIYIPASVAYIEARAFENCTSLSSITVAGDPTLGIPAGPESNDTYLGNDIFTGTLWLKNQGDFATLNGRLVAYQGSGGSVTIPNGVTCIENLAFADKTNVTDVTIPGSVKEIKNCAFKDCANLTTVVLQDGVSIIGDYAFVRCSHLSSITLPTSLTAVSPSIFYGNRGTLDIYYKGTQTQFKKIDNYDSLQIDLSDGTFKTIIHFAIDESGPNPVTPEDPTDPGQPTVAGFTDVPAGKYYADAVAWAVEQGITKGTSATTFSPDGPCTRAQIVTFLWRTAGSPTVSGGNPFTDVAPDSYYNAAVCWAVEQGVTKGTSATTFDPDATCTRAQTVTFLYRYVGSPAISGSNPFTDVASGVYYANAVQWAVNNSITTGTSANTFSPNAICSRGQIVTFLYRAQANQKP